MHINIRDDYKILHMDPDRPNIFLMDRKIKSSLKIGLVELQSVQSYYQCHISNIDKELAWLLPILASQERIKCQIFVLDKATEDLIGEI